MPARVFLALPLSSANRRGRRSGSAQKPETADRARACIALVLKASASNDWDILLYARTIYLKLGDSKDALAVTTRMLELFPTSPAKDNAELREALLRSKSELEAKIGK